MILAHQLLRDCTQLDNRAVLHIPVGEDLVHKVIDAAGKSTNELTGRHVRKVARIVLLVPELDTALNRILYGLGLILGDTFCRISDSVQALFKQLLCRVFDDAQILRSKSIQEIALLDIRWEQRVVSVQILDQLVTIVAKGIEPAAPKLFAEELDDCFPGDPQERRVVVNHDANRMVFGEHEELDGRLAELWSPSGFNRYGTIGRESYRHTIHHYDFRCHFRLRER